MKPIVIFLVVFMILMLCIVSTGCPSHQPPPTQEGAVSYTEMPAPLQRIVENNQKIPPFYCKFGIYTEQGRQHISADGEAWIDKDNDRIHLLLMDTLLDFVVVECLKIGNRVTIYIYGEDQSLLIHSDIRMLNMDRYLVDFPYEIPDLIQLVNGEIPILSFFETIMERPMNGTINYSIYSEDREEVVVLDGETDRVQIVQQYLNQVKLYQIEYERYKDYLGYYEFYFPHLSKIIYYRTMRETTIGIQNIEFYYDFTDDHFIMQASVDDARVYNELGNPNLP